MHKAAKIIKHTLIIFLINIAVGIIYMFISPTCYQYGSPSITDIPALIVFLPLFWAFGAFCSIFIFSLAVKFLITNPEYFLEGPLFLVYLVFGILAIGLGIFLLVFRKKLNPKVRYFLFVLDTILFNIVFLHSFYISMGV